jgi:hypothetical protein
MNLELPMKTVESKQLESYSPLIGFVMGAAVVVSGLKSGN